MCLLYVGRSGYTNIVTFGGRTVLHGLDMWSCVFHTWIVRYSYVGLVCSNIVIGLRRTGHVVSVVCSMYV